MRRGQEGGGSRFRCRRDVTRAKCGSELPRRRQAIPPARLPRQRRAPCAARRAARAAADLLTATAVPSALRMLLRITPDFGFTELAIVDHRILTVPISYAILHIIGAKQTRTFIYNSMSVTINVPASLHATIYIT
jgi:hypothetical protein